MNIRTLCLAILSVREASGYEIKKEIEDGMFSHFIDASFGSIYPALSQLNAEDLVTGRAEEQAGRPDKKVYAITEQGRAALAKGLYVIPARDKYKSEFLFEMLFKDMLPQHHIEQAIVKQMTDMNEDLSRIAQCREQMSVSPGADFVGGYGDAVLRAGLKYLELKLVALRELPAKAAE